MIELIPEIRNAARALIIRHNKILLLKKQGGGRGERFALPGGAQDPGEGLKESLNRECVEEIDTTVTIGNLIYVADFFKLKDTQPPVRQHLVEFLFQCTIADDYSPRNGRHPDKHQVDVVWADLNTLAQLPVYPQYLTECIADYRNAHRHIYLGTFHDQKAPQKH
ncbi:MAG: NUDIX domain-containing protein [Gammaproteobacteria bacterium]|jgi:ADP-ribose pyrophosphatase YjhB (NUDIX family)